MAPRTLFWVTFQRYIEARRLDDLGVLQQLVPQISLRGKQYRMWSNKATRLEEQWKWDEKALKNIEKQVKNDEKWWKTDEIESKTDSK